MKIGKKTSWSTFIHRQRSGIEIRLKRKREFGLLIRANNKKSTDLTINIKN